MVLLASLSTVLLRERSGANFFGQEKLEIDIPLAEWQIIEGRALPRE
jgi:hypothetical protein